MFDTRGQETENAQKNLLEVLQNNKAKYDKGLFADWIVKAYSKCSQDCLITPQMSDLSQREKECATNCLRKYEKGYKLYEHTENVIF